MTRLIYRKLLQIIAVLIFLIFAGGLTAPEAHAGILDFNLVYSSDAMKASTEVTNSVMAYDFAIGIPLGKTNMYAAFNYGSFTSTLTLGTATTWSGTDMGLKFGGFFGRGRLFSSSFTYNFKSIVKFNDGTSDTELRGTSMKIDFGVHYWFDEDMSIALKLFYYAPSLSEEVASTTLTTVAYSRAVMGQGIGYSWSF